MTETVKVEEKQSLVQHSEEPGTNSGLIPYDPQQLAAIVKDRNLSQFTKDFGSVHELIKKL